MEFNKLLKQYDYSLPKELIAQAPASPRDSARLLVYGKTDGKIFYDRFSNIGKYLPKNSVLVFNQTKVIPARLILQKLTGGRVEVLYIDHDKSFVKILANKKLLVGQNLSIPKDGGEFRVVKKENQFYFLKPSFPVNKIKSVLQKFGKTPLPPYIKHSPLTEKQRREQYQTVFAKNGLSVAAPTASLHFTKKLIKNLKKQGIEIKFVTLNVNLGTFAPLTEKNLATGKLHLETYQIKKKVFADIEAAKKNHKPIIAVGTTAVRTLESASARFKLKPSRDGSAMKTGRLIGQTDLFIYPPYQFKLVDGLITNFHVPKSSLLMLVSSLVGRKKLLGLYKEAVKKKFRFFSFGDGMLLLP